MTALVIAMNDRACSAADEDSFGRVTVEAWTGRRLALLHRCGWNQLKVGTVLTNEIRPAGSKLADTWGHNATGIMQKCLKEKGSTVFL